MELREHPPLSREDVHVWTANLDQAKSVAQSFLSILAPDELIRAKKYSFAEHRERFVIARGVLRKLLSRYAGVEPEQLRFCYGPQGKPVLAQRGSDQLCFSVSHSHRLAIYAVTLNRQIGVDVEYLREDLASMEMAERFFATRESETIAALPAELRTVGFFNCWTRKEAYIKAQGSGLSLPLDQFEVSLAPGEPATILWLEDELEQSRNWTLKELALFQGYIGAVAVGGAGWQLTCWDWTDFK